MPLTWLEVVNPTPTRDRYTHQPSSVAGPGRLARHDDSGDGMQALSDHQIEHFRANGYVVVEDAFATGPGSIAEQWTAAAWHRIGLDPGDPSSWPDEKYHLTGERAVSLADFSPKTWAAMGQLCGGCDRLDGPPLWHDAFILNLGHGRSAGWQAPSAAVGGWHADGDFFHHFLDSREQALLTLVLWEDMVHQGGATFIAADSVPLVARYLADHPEGVDPYDTGIPNLIHQCRDLREVTGRAGSVVLLHPFMLHASSVNVAGVARFITNPPVAFRAPMQLDPPASPVEQAICRGLGVARYAFTPTSERRRVVPNRDHIYPDEPTESV